MFSVFDVPPNSILTNRLLFCFSSSLKLLLFFYYFSCLSFTQYPFYVIIPLIVILSLNKPTFYLFLPLLYNVPPNQYQLFLFLPLLLNPPCSSYLLYAANLTSRSTRPLVSGLATGLLDGFPDRLTALPQPSSAKAITNDSLIHHYYQHDNFSSFHCSLEAVPQSQPSHHATLG
ncbi:unnamed protein product [Acanthosepion pharaonis]|uniref:Uncharacterized protein n=1 Tax=Acanthosepion pharaonis TaxID=158019 RepID=A0A812CGP3_ACAPH|nr:unnamed protein product [Sepia pharaonis]